MGKAINTHEDIIAAGEKLEAQSGGDTVAAWQIYKVFEEVGNFKCLKSIWEGHVAARMATPTAVKGGDLPADLGGALGAALKALGAAIRGQFANHIAALVSDHVRQMQLAHTQHSSDKAKQSAQIDFWSESAIGRLEKIEAASAPKPARKPPAKRRTTRAPVKPGPSTYAVEATEAPPTAVEDDQPSLSLK